MDELTSTVHFLLIITDCDGDSHYTTSASYETAHANMVDCLTRIAAEDCEPGDEPEHIEWDGDTPESSNYGWIEGIGTWGFSAEVKRIAHLS